MIGEKKETILVTCTSGRLGYPVAKRLAEGRCYHSFVDRFWNDDW